jgi:hypothetical protein
MMPKRDLLNLRVALTHDLNDWKATCYGHL